MKTFKTPKGTELPLMNLQGKDYLQVAHRVVWMREEKPEWSIETELCDGGYWEAVIKNEQGRVMAMAHKQVLSDKKRFPLETAETGAIGRALALVGFGTSFCGDELNEGDEIADAPLEQSHRVLTQNTVSYNERHDKKMAEPATEPQRKKLFAMTKALGWSDQEGKDWIFEKWGKESSKDLSKNEIQDAFKLLESYASGQ